MSQAIAPRDIGRSDDADLVRRALARDGEAFRTIMQRHNRRLYRIARSILRDDSEAEDAVQETYVNAFARLDRFRGDSSFANLAIPYRDQRSAWAIEARATDHRPREVRNGTA